MSLVVIQPYSHKLPNSRHLHESSQWASDVASVYTVALQASEKVFAITGATGVMLICYLIPVALHLMARHKGLGNQKPSTLDGKMTVGSQGLLASK